MTISLVSTSGFIYDTSFATATPLPIVAGLLLAFFIARGITAIDFEIDIQRKEDPKGDRVVVSFDGKFLPYRQW